MPESLENDGLFLYGIARDNKMTTFKDYLRIKIYLISFREVR